MANPSGRPPKFTPEKRAEFVRLLNAGHSHRTAAERVGGTSRRGHAPLGRPRTRSAMTFRWISEVPPAIVDAKL